MIDQRITSDGLAIVFRAILGLWLFKILIDPFYRMAELPVELWYPMGFFAWIPDSWRSGLWSPTGLLMLKIAIVVCLFAFLTGKAGRVVGIAGATLITAQQAIIRGLGNVNHSDLALLIVLYFVVSMPTDWWQTTSKSTGTQRQQAAIRALGWILVCPYCMIASYRLVNGFPMVFNPSAMSMWLVKLSLRPTWFGFQLGTWVAESALLVKLMTIGFAIITLLEWLTPLCMVNRTFRRLWLWIMIPFHLSTLPLMNIFFWENMILALILFTPIVSKIWPSAVEPAE